MDGGWGHRPLVEIVFSVLGIMVSPCQENERGKIPQTLG